jgi:hypothetical protein
LLTQEFPLAAASTGKGVHTVAELPWGQTRYPDKPVVLLGEGASYPRGEELRTFLAETKGSVAETDWKVPCLRFAPNAPEPTPTEEGWLEGNPHLRKHFALNNPCAQGKRCFSTFLTALQFTSPKLSWYWPTAQMI